MKKKNYCEDENNNEKKRNEFIKLLEKQDYIVQKGELKYIDILEKCSQGLVDSCFGNNVDASSAVVLIPSAPGESVIDWIEKGITFQLTSNEDFIIVYGVDHTKTGKSIYYNTCFYGANKLNGVV